MRNICETFDMSHTYLQRIKKMDNPNVLRRKSLTTLKRHREVHAFYKLPQNATELSEKKKITSKSKGQTTMVLKETLRTLYQGYMQNTENPFSFSLFKSLRPKNVKLSHTEKLNQCLCEMCENVQLKTKTLNPHLPQERRLRSLFDVVRAMLCPSESPFHDLKCLKLECPNCGIQKMKRHLEVEKSSLKNVVNWSRWEANKETKKKIVFKNGSSEDLIAEFLKDTETFPMHLFNAQWQHKEFVDMKTNPGIGTCVSVMDFAENYRCLLQDEIQSTHWSYSQVTLHPVVNYYKCQGCNKTVTDVVAIVSDDLVHDTHAVSVFADRVFQHLQAKSYTFERIVQWKNGCGAQYKCKDAFHNLHSLKKMANRVERNFFWVRSWKKCM